MVPEGKGFSFETQALLGQKMEERKGLQETWRQRQLQKGPDGMKPLRLKNNHQTMKSLSQLLELKPVSSVTMGSIITPLC